MAYAQSRREFAATLSWAGAVGLLGSVSARADEGPPETTAIRIMSYPSVCTAPTFIADAFLREEGFEDIHYIPTDFSDAVARGEVDFDFQTGPWLAAHLDAGQPITALAGLHPGCYELFAQEGIGTVRDLKGRRVGIDALGEAGHLYLTLMAAHVGLDPRTEIEWVTSLNSKLGDLFAKGEIDAFIAHPPEPQELRAQKLGRAILNLTTDKPWSQYFCCILYGNRSFVQDNPLATKRYLRAVLKAADYCASDPAQAARNIVAAGKTPNYDYALQTLTEISYTSWRVFDPEDTMRFYTLRLREVGLVKSSPEQLIVTGTDWRFLNEIKRELKA